MKKSRTAYIIVISALLVSGIWFSFYVKSKVSSIRSMRSSIEKFRQADMTVREDTEVIKDLKKLFPAGSSVTGFIEDIYRIADRHEIKDISFEQKGMEFIDLGSGRILKALPLSGQKPRVVYSYPVKISFNSGYRAMAEFIRELQNHDRLVTVEWLKINRGKDMITVEMIVRIYSTEEG